MTEQIIGKAAASMRVKELLNSSGNRILIGIVGKPGAGKSTLSAYLLKELQSPEITVVPMDGYHFSNAVLQKLGRAERKGAPDTFDAAGFTALLKRIRYENSADIYYPIFDRAIEESIAAQGVVTTETKVVIVEGNYLLHDIGDWKEVAGLLDEIWFVDVDDEIRLQRLIARHIAYGKTPVQAEAWSRGSDEVNAKIIEQTRSRADAVIQLD
ncbi:MAG: nucleoside/nucleotide kinase family protein [Candidatus Nanopelagicaceae bacterium]